jgi:integrase
MARQPKYPKLDHVKYVRAKGNLYAYFNTGTLSLKGKAIYVRLPHPSDVGFYDSYAAMKAARTKRAAVSYLVSDLLRDFDAFTENRTDIKKGTKDLSRHSSKLVLATLGEYPVDKVEPSDVRWMMDNAITGSGSKRHFLAMVRAIYKWGRIEKKTLIDPSKDIKSPKGGEHEPWSDPILKAGLAASDTRTRLSINLLYYTGQRIGDVLKMRWDDIQDGAIYVLQEKTGKEVWPPIHSDLAKVLAETPRTGATILASPAGNPWGDDAIRNDIKTFTTAAGQHCIPHGLRKNAVNSLLEASCTIAEVASITGQSFTIVERYARKVNTRKMGKSAMSKMEDKGGTGKPDAKPEKES